MTSKVVLSVDSLINVFPHKVNKIHGIPTFETLQALQQDLQNNTASISCTLGGGAHGYLGLIMEAIAYEAHAGNDAAGDAQPFINPVFPGDLPTLVGADNNARMQELRVFNHKTYAWCMYENVHQALRTQLVDAIDDTYLSPLRNQVTGYRNVAVLAILTYLFKEYGSITDNEMHANEARFNQPWDGAEPFENIIKRINECVEYARLAQAPYTAVQILSRAKRLVKETGLYHDDMDKWDDVTTAKNWGTFKPFILLAQRKYRTRTGTAKQIGYGLAIQKMTDAVDGVANSVSIDQAKNEVARAKQDAKDAKHDAAMAALNAKLENMEKQYADVIARLSLPASNFTNVTPPAAPFAPAGPAHTKRVPKDEGGYCHTHGYHVIKHHTSANCKWQKEGHQVTATRENPMGGSQVGKPSA
jgi:hypothetical protein